jgi:predicted porin
MFCGAAFADGLTIGGRLDLALQSIDDGTSKTTRVDSGTYAFSRLFFKGVEDLGGGLDALFYLEHRFNADTGLQINPVKYWNGGSYVGLSSTRWGTLTLGRQFPPIFYTILSADESGPGHGHSYTAMASIQRTDLFRIAAAASPVKVAGSFDVIAGGIHSVAFSSGLEDNLAAYASPPFSGATVGLAAGLPEGYPAGNSKLFGANVEYRNDRIFGSVALNSKEGRVPAGGAANQRLREAVISTMYELSSAMKVWGNVHPWNFNSPGARITGHDWIIGGSYWLPTGQLWLSYGRKEVGNCSSCNSAAVGAGYHHLLSKRTELYVSYARVGNQANAANTLNGFAPSAPGKPVQGLAAGIAHSF